MKNKKTLRSTRGVIVTVAILCAGSAMAAASLTTNPGTAATSVKAPLTGVPAGEYVGVCPDPAHLPQGSITGTDPEFSPESTTARSAVSAVVLNDASSEVAPSSLSTLGAKEPLTTMAGSRGQDAASGQGEASGTDPEQQSGDRPAGAVVPSQQVDDPSVLRAQPLGQQQAAAAALLTYTADDGDLRGLATAGCRQPDNNLWIVGANTTLGQTALLTVANPSSTPALVDLGLYGAEGQIDAPGGRGILIPPGGTESVVLGGMAPDENRLAVKVHSSGGSVTASIQQSALRDLTPGGVEYLTAAADPSTKQVVTGVRIQDEQDAAKIADQPGYASTKPVLQVAVPGSTEAVAQVRVFGPDGEQPLDGDGVMTVPGGSVQEITLDELPEGTFTIQVSADVSIVASARMSKGTKPSEPVDMAYATSSSRMGTQHVIPVAADVDSRLVFGAPAGDAEVELTPLDAGGNPGQSTTVQVAAGTTREISVDDLGDGQTVGFMATASGDAVYGAQLLTAGDSADIAAAQVPPAVAGEQELPVFLGY